jgi:predicted transcriptional regulator
LSSNGNNLNVEWRRNKVLELSSQGFTQSDIATVLHVTQPTVNKDLAHIRREAQENLQNHIHETIPQEYQKVMTGINQVLRMCWSIVSKTEDEKTKLQALAVINDCNKYKIDLATNGVVITDAIKYVNQKTEQLDTLNLKLKTPDEDDKEELDENENVHTNAVF